MIDLLLYMTIDEIGLNGYINRKKKESKKMYKEARDAFWSASSFAFKWGDQHLHACPSCSRSRLS